MKEPLRTNQELHKEISTLKQKIKELEQSESERKRASEAPRESKEYFKAIIQNSSDIILVVDKLGTITYASPSTERFLDYRPDELIGKRTLDLIVSDDKPRAIADFGRALQTKEVTIPNFFRIKHKDGTERILEGIGKNLSDNPIVAGFVMNVRDITERKRIEEEGFILAEIGRVIGSTLDIDELYERMAAEIRKLIHFDSLRVNLFNAQQDALNVVYVSGLDIPGRMLGESYPLRGTVLDEVIRTRKGMIVQSENAEDLINKFPSLIVSVRAGIHSIMSIPLIFRDDLIGSLVIRSKKPAAYSEQNLLLMERIGAQIAGPIVNAQLFTELQKTENSLRESEGRFRSLFEQAAVGVAEIEISTSRFLTVNRRLCEIIGRTKEEMLATTFHAITHPEDIPLDDEKRALLSAGKITRYSRVKRYLRKDRESVWVNIMISSLGKQEGKSGRNMIVVEDITERKLAGDRVRLAWEVLDVLNRQMDTVDAIHDILQTIKKSTGFEAIGIRLKEGDDFPYYATNGFPEDFVLAERRLCAYDEDGKILRDKQGNPVLECMCGNIICRRFDASPFFTEDGSFWTNSTTDLLASTTEEDRQSRTRNRCHGEGYESVALIPLKTGDEVIGLLQLNDHRRNRFTLEMIHFFEGLGSSIGIALTRKRAEQQLQDTLESLRKAVGTTIQVLTSTVETRDPYTAGHQTRSADLARGIATEMGLPQEKVDAIRIAGSIHDIGKLSIPAEILSKPAKLSEIEFSLIKEHSRKGFEMLKDVESPWPLAEIVYQHHERMDGSGYPRNLKGEDICIESRILAVADVVESMASHRPYRPALGVDAALDEIEKNRGIFYDDAVADACLRLFREKGFQLAGT
jgi:PAS domain S-box-containing protein